MSDRTVIVRPTGRNPIVLSPRQVIVRADGTAPRLVVRAPVRSTITVTKPQRVAVRTRGIQGPPGRDASALGRISFEVEAGFNISAYQVICPRMLDDSVRVASNDIASHADRPLWLATQSALAGETLLAVSSGRVDNSGWNWIQAPIYLGVDGVMTQAPPDAEDGAVFAAQLGYAISANSMFFDRFTPIFLPT